MKITFIGSSHGYVEPNRNCSCAMLQVKDNIYFIDMGTSPVPTLVTKGYSMNRIKSIFITHRHGDHTNGLVEYMNLLAWHYKTCRPELYVPDYKIKDLLNNLISYCDCSFSDEIKFTEINEGLIYDDGLIKVTAIKTMHTEKSYSFYIEAEGKKVLFTGDLKNPKIDFPEIAKKENLDLLICEDAHFPATDYTDIFNNSNIKSICINHVNPKNLPSIYQMKEEVKAIPISLANDGMEIDL